MRENLRVAVLVASACLLFVALAGLGTRGEPYAPNEWAFSHVILAERAVESGHLPINERVATQNSLSQTNSAFQKSLGFPRLTFYATTVWHFWNGLPLQPSLLATLSVLTGLSPEAASRLPVAGVVVVLLVGATAGLLLARRRGDARAGGIALFAIACGSAPFLLDMRVLMPSTTVVLLALLLHGLLRRALLKDRAALAFSLTPLLLLPFWYYTVAYFVMLLFLAFALGHLLLRRERHSLIPLWVCLLLPLLLAVSLLVNGALTSHLELARQTLGSLWMGPDAGSDYRSHLNREPWRSALLYAQVILLFVPLGWMGVQAAASRMRSQRLGPHRVVFAAWALGGLLFSLLLEGAVGISFLNRSVIYLAPAAAIVAAWTLAPFWEKRSVRVGALAAVALLGLGSAGLVAGATPSYAPGEAPAYGWMAAHVDHGDLVYSSLEASSVLLREDDFVNVVAFPPSETLLERFWYSHDVASLAPYLPSFDEFVLRHAVATQGFEEFGPARLPIGQEAYAKFGASRDLHLVYDDGDVQVFRVAMQPERLPFIT